MTFTVRGAVAVGAIALVVAAIGVGVWVVGPPAEQRVRRLDERRVEDLAYLREQVRSYFGVNKRLPASVEEMKLPADATRDPVTGQPYGYRTTTADAFELCADFSRPSEPERFRFANNGFNHGAGHTCFPEVVKR
jgi:hypothetical protein